MSFGRGHLMSERLYEALNALDEVAGNVFLSAIVPCFNEGEGLDELRRRLIPACERVAGNNFEIILVDDGSTDRTREIMRRFHEDDPRFVPVFLSRNHGHQLALTAGLSVARGRRVFVLDADLQDPPELLEAMMARMDEGYDVVYGKRRSRAGETAFKIGTARLFYRILNRLVEIDIPLDTGDFRLMSRRVVNVLQAMPERHRFVRGMISWIGFPQSAFEYERDERFAGETKYPVRKMILLAIDAITSFSVIPLRVASLAGAFCAFLGVIFGVFTLGAWFSGAVVPGWTSLTLIVLLLGGVQLIVIGIIGEYLGRLYMQSKERPMFLIEEVLRKEHASPQVDRKSA